MILAWTLFTVGLVLGLMGGLTWVTWWFAIAFKDYKPDYE